MVVVFYISKMNTVVCCVLIQIQYCYYDVTFDVISFLTCVARFVNGTWAFFSHTFIIQAFALTMGSFINLDFPIEGPSDGNDAALIAAAERGDMSVDQLLQHGMNK